MPDKPGRVRWMLAEFRTWPRRAKIAVLAILAVELAAPVSIWLAQPDLPHTDPADRPDGDLAVPADLAMPSVAEEEEQPLDEPWEIPIYEGDPRQTYKVQSRFYYDLLETDHGLLIAGTSSAALENDGEIVWEVDADTDTDAVFLFEDVVVLAATVDDDAWAGRDQVTAYSARTGEELWTDDEVDYTNGVDGGLYLTRCGPDDDDDTCTVTARDPADGAVLWSLGEPSTPQFDLPEDGFRPTDPDHLVLETEPADDEFALAPVNRWSGNTIEPTITEGDADLEMAVLGDQALTWTEDDEDPTDGCTSDIAGYTIGATEPAWTVTAETRISDDLAYCEDQPMRTPFAGNLAVTLDSRPAVIDTATGTTTWTGETEAFAYGVGDGIMAAVREEALVGIDMDTGEERWRTEWRDEGSNETRTAGTTMWVRNCGSADLCAVNLETGEIVSLSGEFDYVTEDAVVTSNKVDESTEEVHMWPLDIWA
jgi:hypothetical protein